MITVALLDASGQITAEVTTDDSTAKLYLEKGWVEVDDPQAHIGWQQQKDGTWIETDASKAFVAQVAADAASAQVVIDASAKDAAFADRVVQAMAPGERGAWDALVIRLITEISGAIPKGTESDRLLKFRDAVAQSEKADAIVPLPIASPPIAVLPLS